VLISSCGFPEFGNFEILRQHFRIVCDHMGWVWAGELLIPAAGAAHVPGLFKGKFRLLKRAGAELAGGVIAEETSAALAAPVMPAADYRRMATLSFRGGIAARAVLAALALKNLGIPKKIRK
jgi:hypothetical protein